MSMRKVNVVRMCPARLRGQTNMENRFLAYHFEKAHLCKHLQAQSPRAQHRFEYLVNNFEISHS